MNTKIEEGDKSHDTGTGTRISLSWIWTKNKYKNHFIMFYQELWPNILVYTDFSLTIQNIFTVNH